jgi:D-3-phosphoglycerate dehydrogenase / 2-oxoglutarate reductase
MKSYQIVRTHLSPYQHADFCSKEKTLIENFSNFKYRTLDEFKSNEETILITNTHTKIRDLPPQILRKTKLIIHPNSGYDHFAEEHDLWKDIPLVIGHTIRAQAVAEFSIGAVFEGLQELPQHIVWNEKRNWPRILLKGTPVWLFGFGHIGKIIAETLHALGMNLTVIDPYINECPFTLLNRWQDGPIEEARVIIVATSLNSSSHHLFNDEFFTSLGSEVLFINGARGKLVNEEALKTYLLRNPDSFAFLDVFEKEPFGNEWQGFPQVWKTSHIAGVDKNLDNRILDFEIKVLKDFIEIPNKNFLEMYKNELLQNKWFKGALI